MEKKLHKRHCPCFNISNIQTSTVSVLHSLKHSCFSQVQQHLCLSHFISVVSVPYSRAQTSSAVAALAMICDLWPFRADRDEPPLLASFCVLSLKSKIYLSAAVDFSLPTHYPQDHNSLRIKTFLFLKKKVYPPVTAFLNPGIDDNHLQLLGCTLITSRESLNKLFLVSSMNHER